VTDKPLRLGINLSPDETVEFFRAKGDYPVSRRWWKVWEEEHARAFTVAGVTDSTVLEEVRAQLDDVIANGGTFEMWKAKVLPELQAAVDAGSAPDNIVSNRRLRIIYDTNLRMARAAGQWKRIQAAKVAVPYLMYRAINDRHTRAQHRIWGGLDDDSVQVILPVDHPAWNWLFPPNGWGCRCNVIALGKRDMEARGLRLNTEEELAKLGLPTMANADGNLEGVDTTTFVRGDGVIQQVPTGIDPGFAYNVGKAHMRGLVPPPLEGTISEPVLVAKETLDTFPDLPQPRERSSALLVAKDVPQQVIIDLFIDSFGVRNSSGAVNFTDVLGQPVVIDESFFFRGGARGDDTTEKLIDSDRRKNIRLMAEALRDPDEIWYQWQEVNTKTGTRWRITRRYITRFTIDGKIRPIVVILDIGPTGWKGISAIAASNKNYARNSRGGHLAYRRK
jgi:SPP1 gp7 family putative phage head morphogenesis protein